MSSSVVCHLIRPDGSRWIVTDYSHRADGPVVCAVPEIEVTGARAGNRTRLWKTPLVDFDCLEWTNGDGTVVASRPVRSAE